MDDYILNIMNLLWVFPIALVLIILMYLLDRWSRPKKKPAPRKPSYAEWRRDCLRLDWDLEKFLDKWRELEIPEKPKAWKPFKGIDENDPAPWKASPPATASGCGITEFTFSPDLYKGYEHLSGLDCHGFRVGLYVRHKTSGTIYRIGLYNLDIPSRPYFCYTKTRTCNEPAYAYFPADEIELALPREGEVWADVWCKRHNECQPFREPMQFTVEGDWEGGCVGHKFLMCGCSRPVNFGHGEM